jgi:hypothetical protein
MSNNAPFRQALKIIFDNDGVTTSVLATRGCDRHTLTVLIDAGFVAEVIERAKAGDRAIEIERIMITAAGTQALNG